MKRWGPPLLLVIGVAIGITGWWLYATIEPDPGAGACRLHALYTDFVQASGAMAYCDDTRQQLYLSLGLIVLGPAVFIAGWLLALPPRLTGLATRTHTSPMFAASVLLTALAGLVVAGSFGWQHLQHSRELSRRHKAEAALARLVFPPDMRRPVSARHCTSSVDYRCASSGLAPKALTAELVALVHGQVEPGCPGGTRLLGCPVSVKGTIAGYPAVATAGTEVYFSREEPIPAGAKRLKIGKRLADLYTFGSRVQVLLLIPED